MFELYGIFDKSELIILFLSFVIFVLLIVIFFILVLPKAEKEIVRIEKEIMNDDVKDKIEDEFDLKEDKKDSEEIKKKYEKLLEEKEIKNNEMIKYSPSEFATLLKYNPILPYSAFTMDIINNAYLDFNEQSNFDDR